MPPFDPIASPTVRLAPHREPAFVFPDQAEAARQKLAAYSARTGRRRAPVQVGVGNGTKMQIVRGINPGDKVVLPN